MFLLSLKYFTLVKHALGESTEKQASSSPQTTLPTCAWGSNRGTMPTHLTYRRTNGGTKVQYTKRSSLTWNWCDITVFEPSSDEFTVKVAEKTEEVKALLNVGFEYACQKESLMFLRKRK